MRSPSQNRWLELWEKLGFQGDPVSVYSKLDRHYTEPQRAYHNFSHIYDCLCEFDSAKQLAASSESIEMAIWFHDVIYDVRAKDNEEQSAGLARTTILSAKLPEDFANEVSQLILETKHIKPPHNADGALLVDIDLAILGQSRERFEEYERQIRQEYDWVEAKAFAEGRSAILKSFFKASRHLYYESFPG